MQVIAQAQNEGIDLDSDDAIGTVTQCSGNIISGSCAKNEDGSWAEDKSDRGDCRRSRQD